MRSQLFTNIAMGDVDEALWDADFALRDEEDNVKAHFCRGQVVGTLFTHHQKCVLVDTQENGNNRMITTFLTVINLSDGHHDTPEHKRFHDVDTVSKDHFHNPTFPAGTKAPRQSWHDLHCRVDGRVAYDVLINFEQKWKKASKWKNLDCEKNVLD